MSTQTTTPEAPNHAQQMILDAQHEHLERLERIAAGIVALDEQIAEAYRFIAQQPVPDQGALRLLESLTLKVNACARMLPDQITAAGGL